ncbi:MAG TPA: dihydroxyacetone kinase subunit DhaL [Candidatus Nanopelagicales bacterium]
MPALTKTQFVEMLHRSERVIDEHHVALSELDGELGDGDHGVTILRTMRAVTAACDEGQDQPFAALLKGVAMKVMMCDGGSTSPLFGSYFLGLATGAADDELTAEQAAAMFEAGLERFAATSKAHVGDKTMLDALAPATEALATELRRSGDAPRAFAAAAEAAAQGAARTADLVARFGRARLMGERSVGHLDPGAQSISFIFQGFAQTREGNVDA